MRRFSRRIILASPVILVACDGGSGRAAPTGTPAPVSPTARPPTATATLPPASATPSATPTPAATATPARPAGNPGQPLGFPIDPRTRLGLVVGDVGSRRIAWGEGPEALPYSRDDQPSADPLRANRCGWNARVHFEYEGDPAADWYIPPGTPIVSTMDGTATLLVNTVSNPFEVYGVPTEPYIGNPDRARAPLSPFPGPGGGQGVFVRVDSASFRTDYAHLEPAATFAAVPAEAWVAGYGPGGETIAAFRALRDFRIATAVARWPVKRGGVLGFSGDTGYSEGPHLHYAIRPAGSARALAPTAEPGFPDAGWLFRT